MSGREDDASHGQSRSVPVMRTALESAFEYFCLLFELLLFPLLREARL